MATTNFREKEREAAAKKARERKKKRRKRQALTALIVTLVVSLITLCVLSLTVFFKIADIKVVGSSTYTAEEIISAADISVGDNLIMIFDAQVEERLKTELPFIDEVKIERIFPETLKISVTETREEVCFTNGTGCFSANKRGKIIKEYTSVPETLIKITVSDKVIFKTGEKIIFENEREAELYNNFINMIETYGYEVNFINISDPFGSYMKLENRMIVEFGSSSYFENKAAYLKASLAGVSENAEGVFDLSAWTPENNQPVLTYGDISSYEK